MKTILGIGTALTLAAAPLALDAKPKLKIQGGGAVVQMLNAAIAGNAKELHKAEKELRKAARKAGVPVSVSTVTAAATGGAAAAAATRTQSTDTSTRQVAPAPELAPLTVAQRPQPRPAAFGSAPVETAAATPPVTTVRNGERIETTALDTAPETTPVARRVSTVPGETAAAPLEATAAPSTKVVRADDSTGTPAAQTGQPVLADARPEATPATQPALFEEEASPFGGPTGY